jgi:large subunit ribosomal protein L4
MYRAAMQSLLSELVRRGHLKIVESLEVAEPRTRLMVDKLKELNVVNGLFVVEAFDEKLYLASRNLPNVEVLEVTALDPVSLLRYDQVVMTVAAVRRLEEKLG